MSFERHEIEWTPEKVARIWDHYASHPSFRHTFFGYQSGRHVVRKIHRELGFRHRRRILDLSCGLGDVVAACLPYMSPGQTIVGTDFSRSNVAQVNSRFSDRAEFGGAHLVREFPCELDAESFDLVMATEVVEHLDDRELESFLRECSRLLVVGGHLVLTTPNDEDYESEKVLCPDCGCVFHRWQHLRTWTATSLRDKVEEYGFGTTTVQPTAWVSRLRRIASLVKPAAKTGLFYLGQKQSAAASQPPRSGA